MLVAAMRAEGVDTRNYYDPPVHLHTAYRHLAPLYRGKLPVTERLARECVSLPMYSHMDTEVVRRVCEAIRRIQRHSTAVRAALS
jgi:dTDP-4-amino-4,6-dideoxygalactose transaminase